MEKDLFVQFMTKKINSYQEPVKSGVPKGHEVGFMRPKYMAAVLSLTDAKPKIVAEKVGTTAGTISVWKTQPAFQKQVHELAREFAVEFWEAFKTFWEAAESAYNIGQKPPSYLDFISNTELLGDEVVMAIFGNMPGWVDRIQAHCAVTIIYRKKDKLSGKIESINSTIRTRLHDDAIRIMQQPRISEQDRKFVLTVLHQTRPLP